MNFNPPLESKLVLSKLLAGAVLKSFPDAMLLESSDTAEGFYVDVLLHKQFSDEFLPYIEDHLRGLVKENLEISTSEMMGKSAIELFKSFNQPFLIEKIEHNKDGIVNVLRLNHSVDLSPIPINLKTKTLPHFKIIKSYLLDGSKKISVVRLLGIVGEDKESLKESFKNFNKSTQDIHQVRGPQLKIFSETVEIEKGLWCWESNGWLYKQFLQNLWAKLLQKFDFEIVSTPVMAMEAPSPETQIYFSHAAHFKRVKNPSDKGVYRVAEVFSFEQEEFKDYFNGVFDSKNFLKDGAHVFCLEGSLYEECISSLNLILEIPKMFGFKFKVFLKAPLGKHHFNRASGQKQFKLLEKVLVSSGVPFEISDNDNLFAVGPAIEVKVEDRIGRLWTFSQLAIDTRYGGKLKLSHSVITLSLFQTFERCVALVLEQTPERIPFSLAPIQVQLVSQDVKSIAYAKQIKHYLMQQGIRCAQEIWSFPLDKGQRGLQQIIPYCIVVSEKDSLSETLVLQSREFSTVMGWQEAGKQLSLEGKIQIDN